MISAREAADLFRPTGIAREQVRRLLNAGFVGAPVRTRGALLFDVHRVLELRDRLPISQDELAARCPDGAFVQRAWRGVDVTVGFEELKSRLRLHWPQSPWTRVLVYEAVATRGFYPWLLTTSTYVAVGAEIVGFDVARDPGSAGHAPQSTLRLRPAGSWYADLAGRPLDSGPGGPWVVWPTCARRS